LELSLLSTTSLEEHLLHTYATAYRHRAYKQWIRWVVYNGLVQRESTSSQTFCLCPNSRSCDALSQGLFLSGWRSSKGGV